MGGKYTWYRSKGRTNSRFDRIFVSSEWMEQGSDCKQYIKVKQVSDHCALVLKTSSVDWGPKPFRSLEVWNTTSGFTDMVRERWSKYTRSENSLVIMRENF